MEAKILDGKALSHSRMKSIAERVARLKQTKGKAPGLAVVLAGDNPASEVYVRNKQKACQNIGINSSVNKLGANVTQACLLKLIDQLNNDNNINGILIQLPLPPHIDTKVVIEAIHPEKDVDGFHPINAGRLMKGDRCFEPCTPKGIILLAEHTGEKISGKNVVIIGRSNIVGKPAALMFIQKDATVTVCHSRTAHLDEISSKADILVVAVGRPHFVDDRFVKDGAIVIDVGINRAGNRITGDVDFEKVRLKAGWITPVPGGVGPMTIAMLLDNTVWAAERYE